MADNIPNADKPSGKDRERNRMSGRMGRYARVSTSMAGLAARLAGQQLFSSKNPQKRAEDIKAVIGNLRGPLVKVAQLLATIPEALPPEYATEFQQLQSNAPPMGWPFVRRRMRTELGPDWEFKFAFFEREAAAAASLGQVHKAMTHDGQTIACKLQYPDMESAVSADLQQLKIFLNLFERYDRAVSTKYIQKELADRLMEELDYQLEAKYCKLYKSMLAEEKTTHVADVVDDLCASRLLTTTWLDGTPILEYKNSDTETRNSIALNLLRAGYVPFYEYGVIHGDPHLGNYSVRKDLSLNLLDFGCVRIFPPSFVQGVIELYYALETDDKDRAVAAYETWGFENLNNELIDVLTLWARFLYGPLLDNSKRVIGKAEGSFYGQELAREVHTKLREVGGVTVPREFVFMDRAALGLGSVFIHLQAEMNWHTLFNEMISGFDIDKMKKKQKLQLDNHAIAQKD